MEHQAIPFLAKFGIARPEEAAIILKHMDLVTCQKGDLLLQEGTIAKQCFFLLQGCIRQFQLVDGEEKSQDFYVDESVVIVYDSYLHNQPAGYNLDCLEECILLAGTKAQQEELEKVFPNFTLLTHSFLTHDYNKVHERLASFVNLSAEDRYRWLEANHPNLLNRVPLRHLASYIGVTPESFSRIRKRIMAKG